MDGFQRYISAIEDTLSDRVGYAQLIKVYAAPREREQRYSPADVVGAGPRPVPGNPDRKRICTSHVERQNLTMRIQIRRLTRLTNGVSKKWENLRAALCLHFAWYNLYGFTKRCASRPQWKRELWIGFGRLRIF
jgi:hypothetical protein